MKLLTIGLTLIICLWPHATSAQYVPEAVLDTEGNPLRAGVEYFIKPAAAPPDSAELVNLVSRTADTCPVAVGLSDTFTEFNPAVTFEPVEEGEDVVRKGKNFKVTFSGLNPCGGSSTWRVGGFDAWARSRLIDTGFGTECLNFFYLSPAASEGVFEHAYTFDWCPTEVCPIHSSACGTVDLLVYMGGTRLFVLGRSSNFPVVFQRVYYTDGHVKQA